MNIKHLLRQLWLITGLLLGAGLLTACGSSQQLPGIETTLLVGAPEHALPVNKPVIVKAQVVAEEGVSHAELYLGPAAGQDTDMVLLRADAPQPAAYPTTYVVSQQFTPLQPGDYVIKVVGYNRLGLADTSDYLSFKVTN
jgi:hypothetical protein